MNLLSKIALLFGRRKFEEFAQANPALPDDALAVANTLDTYASYGNWTNSGGSATMNGGALICIGSNEYWLVAAGRALGSVTGTAAKEYPTNAVSGFLAQPLNNMRSNLTSIAVRDETNALWLLSVSTNASPPAVYLGTTNNPTATLLVPATVTNGLPSLIIVTNGLTIDSYVGGLLSNSVSYPLWQDTNIIASADDFGMATLYSSRISNISGALITCSTDFSSAISSGNGIIVNVLSHAPNSVTILYSDPDDGNPGIGISVTNTIHFFR